MRRSLGMTVAALSGWMASACPVYDDAYCSFDMDCAPGLLCDVRSGNCYSPEVECSEPRDCYVNETCGADGLCHVGDCFFHGCVAEHECVADESGYRCAAEGTGAAPSDGGAAGTAGSTDSGTSPSGAAGSAGAGTAGISDTELSIAGNAGR